MYPWNFDKIKDSPEILACYDWCEVYAVIKGIEVKKKDGGE
jgi:hypothetical protein